MVGVGARTGKDRKTHMRKKNHTPTRTDPRTFFSIKNPSAEGMSND